MVAEPEIKNPTAGDGVFVDVMRWHKLVFFRHDHNAGSASVTWRDHEGEAEVALGPDWHKAFFFAPSQRPRWDGFSSE